MMDLRTDDSPTLAFVVQGMVNGRMAAAVSRAVRALDHAAIVRTDPGTRRLEVQPVSSDVEDIVETLYSSGFNAILSLSPVDPTVEPAAASSGDEPGLPAMTSAFARAEFGPAATQAQDSPGVEPGAAAATASHGDPSGQVYACAQR